MRPRAHQPRPLPGLQAPARPRAQRASPRQALHLTSRELSPPPIDRLPDSPSRNGPESPTAGAFRDGLSRRGGKSTPSGTMGHMANRLSDATSPYLLQHAGNPVDWWEWGPDAFAEARRRGVPVLLSVGYAACHWCHVMAHESFEDDATAAYLNEHFVSVKVDREERPDVDAVYMEATTAMTGHGGWPMTCVLDHEGGPFFAGTYFPDRPRHGQPSFRQVLEAVVDAWTNRGDDVRRVAGQLREHLNRAAPTAAGIFDEEVLSAAVASLARDFDEEHAGFGTAPKFPPSMVLELLLRVSTGLGGPDGHRRRGAAADARRHAPGDGPRRHLRPARGRLRALRGRPGLGGAALREDALRQRPADRGLRPARRAVVAPHRSGHRGLRDPRARHRGGGLRLRPGRGQRGRGGQVLRLDAGPAGRGAGRGRRRVGGRVLRGHRGGHLRARYVDAAAAGRPRRRRAARLGPRATARRPGGAGPARARRQGGRRVERPRDQRAVRPGRAHRRAALPGRRRRRRRAARRRAPRRGPAAPGVPRRTRRAARGRAGGPRLRRLRLPVPAAGDRGPALAHPRRRGPRGGADPLPGRGRRLPRHRGRRGGVWSPGRATRPTTRARRACPPPCTRWPSTRR